MQESKTLNSNIGSAINALAGHLPAGEATKKITKEKNRNSGIDIIGNIAWGTHLCQFYNTKKDLIDILVPYFKAGLENNEFCMWVTSSPLGDKEAENAMRESVPDLDRYLKHGQIEIVPHTEWYYKGGTFNLRKVLNAWLDKLNQAVANGYDGMRVTGNTSWLEKKDWKDFTNYEKEINKAVNKYRMLAICTYPLDKCGSSDVIDVVNNHQFALIRREGKWERLESSEHKMALEEIKRTAKKWEATFNSINDLVWIQDRDFRIIRANKAFCDILKVDPEKVIGKKCYEVIHGIKEPWPNCPHKRMLETGKVVTSEIFEPRLEAHLEISVSPMFDEKSEVSGCVHIAKDITERKKAEEKIKNLAKFPEENLNPVYRISKDGILLYANPASRILVLEDQTKIGDKIPEKWIGMIKSAYDSGKKQEVEVELSGRVFLFVQIPVIEDGYVNSYGIDISERKKADVKLKENRERLALALSAADMGTWRWNIATNQDTRDENFNRILGLEEKESTQPVEDFFRYVHPEDRALTEEKIQRAIRQHDPYQAEFRITRPDGTIHWLNDRGEVFYDAKGHPAYMTGAVIDITKRKEKEEVLKKTAHNLRERTKELNCLYKISMLVEKSSISLEEIFQETVNLILPAWQYPNIVCAKITFGDKEFKTDNCRETNHKLTSIIKLYGNKAGAVEIGYLEEPPKARKEPFLKSEKDLLNVIALRLGRIAERIKADEALKERRAFSEALFEYNPIETIVVDREGRITMVNRAKKASGDRAPNIGEIMYKDYGAKHEIDMYAKLMKCLKSGRVKDFPELRYDEKYLAITISPFSEGAIITSRDITKHKQVDDAVRRKLEFETAVYNISSRFVSVSDFIETSDIDKAISESLADIGTLSRASRAHLFLFRKNQTTVDNTHEWCQKSVTPQINNLKNISSRSIPWWIKKLKKRKTIHVEDVSRLPMAAKKEKEILKRQGIKSLLVLPLTIEGELAGCIGFDNVRHTVKWNEDDLMLLRITSEIIGNALERKRAEDKTRDEKKRAEDLLIKLNDAYKKLKKTQNELVRHEKIATTGTLVAGVAHEIRNPLAIIGMTVQYLQSKLKDNDPKRELTEAIIAKVERLDRVTRELSSYARTIRLNIKKHNLARCLNMNLALVKPRCRIQKIKIIKSYSRFPLIYMDDEQMDKAFLNILDNALGAMPKGGRLTVSTEFEEGTKTAVIKLHNTGLLMKKKDMPHIFEPFYTSRKSKGTGLGLAIAQSAVSRHGGQISAENIPSGRDKGVVFTICLPISSPPQTKRDN